MATCSVCRTDFPTSYMDTVSICPKCGTTFWNDSPYYLSNQANPPKSVESKEKKKNRNKNKKH